MACTQKIIQGRIAGTSFLSCVLSAGSLQIIGTYMPALSDEFNVGSAVLGWICSFGYAMLCLAGPVAGVIINKAEPRWVVMTGGLIQASALILTYLAKTTTVLYFSLGLLPGFGASLVYVSAQISVATYFTSYYTTAVGIVISGTGVGIILLPPLIEKLIVVYGWRGAVLIHGALILNVLVMGALLPRHRGQQRIARNTDMTEKKKHKADPQYHQVSPNTDEGKVKSASKLSEVLESENHYLCWVLEVYLDEFFMAFPSMPRSCCRRQCIIMMTLIAAAVLTFVNPLANNYPGYVVSATCIGVTSGIQIPLVYTIIRRNVGSLRLATAVGMELLVDGLAIIVGGYLAGAIQQLSGNYSLSFYLVGSAYTLAVCFFLPVLLMERRAKTWTPIPTASAKTDVGTRV
ncbi:monocarboxylate transporter 13-like [Amphiura filiformis]|uniref:monocarboxylate transporter 13-like n=1 Tax=Amphiura filiformis TaxID=82378 RepID=UPI003B2275EF